MATYDEITNRLAQDEFVKEFWSRSLTFSKNLNLGIENYKLETLKKVSISHQLATTHWKMLELQRLYLKN
ncbi:hypothetical protein [Carnobacterium divergens]|uniref:hypothetical protein n=1 Tax=Carnobacterium divergens TaxID=2748 RepID=UPI000941DB28|nr:hypothetical protein [Carnobacterium divergens]